jgi:hypothetical protein
MGKRLRTFEEWVASFNEGKKGIVPDFINDKLKGKKEDKSEKVEDEGEGKDKGKKSPPWAKKDKKDKKEKK